MGACSNCQKGSLSNNKEEKLSFFDNLITKYYTALFVLKLIPNFKIFKRFVRGYFRVNFLKKEQIRFVEIFVTLACNAKCDFCSNGLFTKKVGILSLEKYLDIIDQCAKLDVPVIGLIGGEPMLYKGINDLVKRAKYHGIYSILATNGTLLNETKVKELADLGLNNITISIHSLDSNKHDSILKIKGAYENAFKVKDYCKKYGLDFSMASVASHQDFSDGTFDRMIDFAEKEKIYLTVNPIIPTGYASTKQELLLDSEDVKKLNEISRRSIYVSTHLTNNYFGFGCPAGNAYIGVNVTGEMFPCFFIPVSLGNVQNMSLRQAWEKACSSPLFTKRHKMCYAAYSR